MDLDVGQVVQMWGCGESRQMSIWGKRYTAFGPDILVQNFMSTDKLESI